jgi:hypothetical protein
VNAINGLTEMFKRNQDKQTELGYTAYHTIKEINDFISKMDQMNDDLLYIKKGIIALENEEKYEKALKFIVENLLIKRDEVFCENHCPLTMNCKTQNCYEQIIKYVKRRVGINEN